MIYYQIGDATQPTGDGEKIIIHICNDVGLWGAGFVLALSKRWQQPEKSYRNMEEYNRGSVQVVRVDEDTWVANMIAQNGIYNHYNKTPIDYQALERCLNVVRSMCDPEDTTIHMPRIGCGLAGGKWDRVEEILQRVLPEVDMYVYDLPDQT